MRDNAEQRSSIREENPLKWWVFLTVLEDKMLTVFLKIVCELSLRDLKACHRLRKNSDKVIVKTSRCKGYEQILSVEKDLKKVKMQDIGLTSSQSIFVNTSLCPYYRMLLSQC